MGNVNQNIKNFPHQLSLRQSSASDSTEGSADAGVQDVIVAAGPGGGPHVKVLDGTSFFDGRLLTADDLTRDTSTARSASSAGAFPDITSLQHTAGDGGGLPATLLAPPPAPLADLGTTVEGSAGNDMMMQSGASWETLLGLGGNDVFVAVAEKSGPAPDTWDGGSGINRADFSQAHGAVQVNLAYGTAWREYHDPYYGTQFDGSINLINIQDVVGSAHADQIVGDAANNRIWGGAGNDWLQADAGDDWIIAGSGDDVVIGGAGNDWISGGSGADVIRWNAGDLGLDTIEGFALGEDTLDFGAGFLAGDTTDSLLVFNESGHALLAANTAESGWQFIARFNGLSVASLDTAIGNGVAFGYEVGSLGEGAPGGLAGGRSDADGPGAFPWQVSLRSAAASPEGGGLIYAGESGRSAPDTPAADGPFPDGISVEDGASPSATGGGENDRALITDFPPAHALASDLLFG